MNVQNIALNAKIGSIEYKSYTAQISLLDKTMGGKIVQEIKDKN